MSVLFENIGEKLCLIAKIMFYLFLVAGVAFFVVYWYSMGSLSDFLLPLLVSAVFTALSEGLLVFPLYGLGRLIQNSEEIKRKLNDE